MLPGIECKANTLPAVMSLQPWKNKLLTCSGICVVALINGAKDY